MNIKQITLTFLGTLFWVTLGSWITNWLFYGYSITPLNNNHLYFFAAWCSLPILIIGLIQVHKITNQADTPLSVEENEKK